MKKIVLTIISSMLLIACNNKTNKDLQGKAERDELAVVGKLAGRIETILVKEGDFVKKGDTLAVLDIPEISAKKAQAEGAVKSAKAQYQMATAGATQNQLKQLNAKKSALKEQYEFAKKTLSRMEALVKDSLISQQQYDEIFAKYQGAQSQLLAVDAEIADVQNGVRMEQQIMALGQQDRASGALQEVNVAEKERYIIAPQDMQIDLITLKQGELALPGYTLFKGVLPSTIYFRFTISESELGKYKKGETMHVFIPYLNENIETEIQSIKQIGSYANITTAYPDFDMQEALYEMIVFPKQNTNTDDILTYSTVILKN